MCHLVLALWYRLKISPDVHCFCSCLPGSPPVKLGHTPYIYRLTRFILRVITTHGKWWRMALWLHVHGDDCNSIFFHKLLRRVIGCRVYDYKYLATNNHLQGGAFLWLFLIVMARVVDISCCTAQRCLFCFAILYFLVCFLIFVRFERFWCVGSRVRVRRSINLIVPMLSVGVF